MAESVRAIVFPAKNFPMPPTNQKVIENGIILISREMAQILGQVKREN